MSSETRYRHWKNVQEPGATCFVTTTCLDFAHLFKRESLRDTVMESLLQDAVHYNARLHAFVVITHHMHLLITPDENTTISELMKSIKQNITRRIKPLLNESERVQLSDQAGLNRSTIWKPSFRSTGLRTEAVFLQKLEYIHLNPVRSELVSLPSDYLWSSAYWYQIGMKFDGWQLDCPQILRSLKRLSI